MASPMPLLSIIFGIGMVVGGVALAMLPLAPERPQPMMASVRVADLSPPCKRNCTPPRAMPSRDAAKPEEAGSAKLRASAPVEVASPAPEIVTEPPSPPESVRPTRPAIAAPMVPRVRVAAAFAQLPSAVETVAMRPAPAEPTPAAPITETTRVERIPPITEAPKGPPRTKSDTARAPRNAGPIAVTAVASNGARRTVMIRPTSQQDIYYYAARRQFAAANPGRSQ